VNAGLGRRVARAPRLPRSDSRKPISYVYFRPHSAETRHEYLPVEPGICEQCKTKLISGRATMETEDALSAAEKARGFILACQAHAVGDVTVDA
jgi:hypothetical protein